MTKEEVRALFIYDNGKLFWKVNRGSQYCLKGKRAGGINNKGYRIIETSGKAYPEHRLIFLYHHGYLPNQIDHINRNKIDNRVENLREASASQNKANSNSYAGSKSKYKGVYKRQSGKYQAQLRYNNKLYSLGCFHTEEEAAKAYDKKALEVFGEFAKLNFPDKAV